MPILFDLDGTLINSLTDLACAANHAVTCLGGQAHPIEDYGAMVGNGARMLISRALGPDREAQLEQAMPLFHAYYAEHLFDHTAPYDGIAELLDTLVKRRMPIAILTNKPHAATVPIVERLLGSWPWAKILGQREGIPIKPDPTGAMEIAHHLKANPADCFFVGDSDVDMLTGRNAGMTAVGVTWGFRPAEELRTAGAHHLIDHPRDLLSYL